MRAAICTPVDFPTDGQFFGRDTGLLCRGFQVLGIDCVVVMPGNPKQETHADVIRTSVADLSDAAWWRSLNLDLVVLYAWGDPRHRQIAAAIRAAGIMLIQSLDTAGLHTPWGDLREWYLSLFGMMAADSKPLRISRLAARALRDVFPRVYEKKRLAMIDCSDRVAVVSPPAGRSVSAYASALGFPHIASKILVAPHPVVPSMTASAPDKSNKVLVVGRWLSEDRAQKDPVMTMSVLGEFLKARPGWTAEVVGRGSTTLESYAREWKKDSSNRLTLSEAVPRNELIDRYQQSRILLCASRHESFHISSAEAVCCGCSVVVADHPLLASTGWFTTKNSGALAPVRSAEALVKALDDEANAWEDGRRDATHIGREWGAVLHAHQVAAGIISALSPS